MSETMVERVARAIVHELWGKDRYPNDFDKRAALAALKAMPPATDAMLKAGGIAFYGSKQDVLAARLPEVWAAMLSAAISEAEQPMKAPSANAK